MTFVVYFTKATCSNESVELKKSEFDHGSKFINHQSKISRVFQGTGMSVPYQDEQVELPITFVILADTSTRCCQKSSCTPPEWDSEKESVKMYNFQQERALVMLAVVPEFLTSLRFPCC